MDCKSTLFFRPFDSHQDCCGAAVEAECANPVPGSVILLEAAGWKFGSLVKVGTSCGCFFFFDFFISLNQRFSGWCLTFCGFPSSNKEWRNNFIKLYLHLLYWLFLGMDFDFQLLGMPEIGRFEGLEPSLFGKILVLWYSGIINCHSFWKDYSGGPELSHFAAGCGGRYDLAPPELSVSRRRGGRGRWQGQERGSLGSYCCILQTEMCLLCT